MQVKYKTEKLRKICTDASIARRWYGESMAEKIQQRIDELLAVDSVEQMLQFKIGRCHKLYGNRKDQYALDLIHPYRLVFIKLKTQIQIVSVIDIVDYH